jgi:plastocyanin
VRVGQRFQWRNADTLVHTATGDGGSFDTGPIAPGSTSGPRTLGVPGTVTYHCSIHPSMVGQLVVTR